MIAATDGVDLARLLLDLLIVLAAAKLLAELAERVRVPAVLGEILAGILIGPSVLGLVDITDTRGVSLTMLAEIGVLLLLLQVGMEMDLVELRKVGATSLVVAVIGVVAPFASGMAVALAFGESTNTAIFIGAALTATSVGITARVFGDLHALATTEARVVLGAAVADDVLGLVILSYLAFISKDIPVGTKIAVADGLISMPDTLEGDVARGEALYTTKQCITCHGPDGQGVGVLPALWGPQSYSVGASMTRLERAASFIRHNMPQTAPGTLSDQEAFDLSAYINSHPRPDSPGKELDWPSGGAPSDVPYDTKGHKAFRPPALIPRRNVAGALVPNPPSIRRPAR